MLTKPKGMSARHWVHGMSGTPTHNTWIRMRARCSNPRIDAYRWYGARGIEVCAAWEDFMVFLSDMGPRPDGMELDRINPDGNYCKENCRWVTHMENANNTRTNRRIMVNGEAMTIAEASRRFGPRQGTILKRLSLGWSDTDAVTVEVKRGRIHHGAH